MANVFCWGDLLNIFDSLKNLNKFEWTLWLGSVVAVVSSFVAFGDYNPLTLVASLVGVTALIFVSKGDVLGPFIMVAFCLMYGVISYEQRYYGEIITYVCMCAPISALSIITWLKNPYSKTEVKISKVTGKNLVILIILSVVVTVAFWYILKFLGNASLVISTISVTTSFFAAGLSALRSPYYAIAYALNDIVLIVLWVIASFNSLSCVSMVVCFVVFLVNDLYGFINWKRMQRKQACAD